MKSERDERLGEAFRKLREEEIESALAFRKPSTRGKVREAAMVFRPAAVVAMVVFAIVIGVVFAPSIDRSHDPDAHEIATVDLELTVRQMPTDFLLETPGGDLMTSTPRFTLSTPTLKNQEGTLR